MRRRPAGRGWASPRLVGALLAVLPAWPLMPAGASASPPGAPALAAHPAEVAAVGLDPAGVAQAWHDQRDRVLELLLQDTRQLLSPPRQGAAAGAAAGSVGWAGSPVAVPAAAEPAVAPPADAVRLSALYGVEPHYTVVLELDGRRRTYRPGASLPLEQPDRQRAWRLLRVQERCAVLRRPDGTVRTVCHVPREAAETPDEHGARLLAQPLPGLSR